MKRLRDFLNNYFFYRVDKDVKKKVRKNIINNDHRPYLIFLVFIIVFQLLMLLSNIILIGFKLDFSIISSTYIKPGISNLILRILYVFLILVCISSFIVVKKIYKKEKSLVYFVIVSLTMVAILVWGCGVSIIDSRHRTNLTVFSYTTMACSLFILLEPKISSINILSITSAFLVAFNRLTANGIICTDTGKTGIGFYINTLSIAIIAIIGSTYNFYRRMKSYEYETKISDLNASLQDKVFYDSLTKVHSRQFLTEHIDTVLDISESPTGIMLLDIDHFKNLNDTYGHLNGDICLKELGRLILESLNDKNDSYCVRFGGEEFLIYYKNTNIKELIKNAEELRLTIKNSDIVLREGKKIRFTVSIGCAIAKEYQTYNSLINDADEALYKAKETRNTCYMYEETK